MVGCVKIFSSYNVQTSNQETNTSQRQNTERKSSTDAKKGLLTYLSDELNHGGTRLVHVKLGTDVCEPADRNLQADVRHEEGEEDACEKHGHKYVLLLLQT